MSVFLDYTQLDSHTRQESSEASDQPVAGTATYTTRNKYKRLKTLHSVKFKLAMPEIKRRQTDAIDRTPTGINRR
jgi:hypothetical protein